MKTKILFPLLSLSVALMSGCATYNYQIVEPANLSHLIADQPLTVTYDPLQYGFVRHNDRLSMTIINPTDDRMRLLGDQSFIVDTRGESHPLRGRILAPHSYARMLLPPIPASYQTTYGPSGFIGPGYGFGYPYGWGGFYDDFYYGPVTTSYQVHAPYDWRWEAGPIRLRLTYSRAGKNFDHDFVIARQREK